MRIVGCCCWCWDDLVVGECEDWVEGRRALLLLVVVAGSLEVLGRVLVVASGSGLTEVPSAVVVVVEGASMVVVVVVVLVSGAEGSVRKGVMGGNWRRSRRPLVGWGCLSLDRDLVVLLVSGSADGGPNMESRRVASSCERRRSARSSAVSRACSFASRERGVGRRGSGFFLSSGEDDVASGGSFVAGCVSVSMSMASGESSIVTAVVVSRLVRREAFRLVIASSSLSSSSSRRALGARTGLRPPAPVLRGLLGLLMVEGARCLPFDGMMSSSSSSSMSGSSSLLIQMRSISRLSTSGSSSLTTATICSTTR